MTLSSIDNADENREADERELPRSFRHDDAKAGAVSRGSVTGESRKGERGGLFAAIGPVDEQEESTRTRERDSKHGLVHVLRKTGLTFY